ncbi:class I SAM-dependent methyltransferase [Nonomuraea muscovyensis]|uniref:class I SAM-dependent methyltransferase n=1 Tax=Nonomuraea muscovyensis TaxID=1124761 RepID=UPI0033DF27DC
MSASRDTTARWNHNIHYHPLILGAVPAGARDALDVGCGEGMLARALRRTVPRVVGIDPDPDGIELARSHGDDVEYVLGDFLAHPFAPESFDMVTAVATLHHLDAAAALDRVRELLRPGGRLVVVGLARGGGPAGLPYELAGLVAHRWHTLTRPYWEHPSPVAAPAQTYAAMRELARRTLPGARFRRHALWRYSLCWTKPGEGVLG